MVPDALDGQVASTGFSILRGAVGVSSTYLFYYTLTKGFLDALDVLQRGTSYPAVRDEDVRSQLIPLAPTAEQECIVAEIETQFTRLDAGVAALKRAQANLKRYKAAVLKAACEGSLVPQDPSDEPASELRARILAERRAKWADDLRAKGKNPGTARYDDPAASNTDELPGLPNGWCWGTIEQLSTVVRGASPRPAGDPRYFGGSIPWITVGSLTADSKPFLTAVSDFVTEAGCAASRYIEPETLLLTNSGATLGVPKITLIGGCINDGSVALLHVDYPLKLYLCYFLSSITLRLRTINQGAAQPNLNTGIVKAITVPLPPLAEQERIVAEVERRLSVVQEQETVIAHSLKRAERLRQAILARAFAGKLVPQDQSDEPASVLLERIRAGRAGQSAAPKRREARHVSSTPMHLRQSRDESNDNGAVQLTLPVA